MTTVVDGGPSDDLAVTGGPKYVFITSFTYTGNLGGLAGADNTCSTLAASAGHGGSWKAWLSDETTDAVDRINEVGPWYAMGTTTVVAQNKLGFAYKPASSIASDQNGTGTSNLHGIWTGTKVGGTRATGETCQSWTSASGLNTGFFVQEYGSGTAGWTHFGGYGCNSSYHLACLQQ